MVYFCDFLSFCSNLRKQFLHKVWSKQYFILSRHLFKKKERLRKGAKMSKFYFIFLLCFWYFLFIYFWIELIWIFDCWNKSTYVVSKYVSKQMKCFWIIFFQGFRNVTEWQFWMKQIISKTYCYTFSCFHNFRNFSFGKETLENER